MPTRNRTLSECSNQTYSALKNGQRCNTISGSRPYATQKHSDSPPINTPMKCSESEESSISIDEADDKGMFETYRIGYVFNICILTFIERKQLTQFYSLFLSSRTSEGIIPEENMDDFASDNSKLSQINGSVPHQGNIVRNAFNYFYFIHRKLCKLYFYDPNQLNP